MCLRPRHITTVTGERRSVPCHCCEECLVNRSRTLSNLLVREFDNSPYSLFFTCTYDNVHIPLIRMVYEHLNCADGESLVKYGYQIVSERIFNDKKCPYDLDENNCIKDMYTTCTLKDFMSKVRPVFTYKCMRTLPSNCFGIPYKRDIQILLKKIRTYVSRKFKDFEPEDIQIRSFYCSEFGPRTYRPHFHGMLFFKRPEVADYVLEIFHSLWTYGCKCDIQYANSDKAGQYIANYVNSMCLLPSFLRSDFKPFQRSSNFLGIRDYVEKSRENKTFDFKTVGTVYYRQNLTTKEFTSPSSFKRSVFPKCVGFSESPLAILYQRYNLYESATQYYGTRDINELAQSIFIDYSEKWAKIFAPYDLFIRHSTYKEDTFHLDTNVKDPFGKVKNALYVSRAFLSQFGTSPQDLIRGVQIIKDYYSDECLYILNKWYAKLEEKYYSSWYASFYRKYDGDYEKLGFSLQDVDMDLFMSPFEYDIDCHSDTFYLFDDFFDPNIFDYQEHFGRFSIDHLNNTQNTHFHNKRLADAKRNLKFSVKHRELYDEVVLDKIFS